MWPPHEAVPVLAGAVGQRTVRLAGEHADGVILTGGTPPERVREVRGIVGAGRIVVYVDGLSGDAATVADGIGRWVEAGADTVVLQPAADEPDPEAFVRFVATVPPEGQLIVSAQYPRLVEIARLGQAPVVTYAASPNDVPDARFSLASAYSRLGRKEAAARELAEFKRLAHLPK